MIICVYNVVLIAGELHADAYCKLADNIWLQHYLDGSHYFCKESNHPKTG